MTMWGVRNNQSQLDFVANEFIAIGWDELGDLKLVADDKQVMQARVTKTRRNVPPGERGVSKRAGFGAAALAPGSAGCQLSGRIVRS